MYHFSFTIRRYYLRFYHFQRHISSSSSKKPLNPPHNFPNLSLSPPQISPNYNLAPSPTSQFSRSPLIAISASVISVLFASVAYLSYDNQRHHDDISSHNNPLQQAAQKYGESFDQIFRHVNRTCVAASVLWKSLTSVLSSANHEVRSGFEIRVAALLADIAAANSSRRAAIVGAGGGAVVDWLLESVAVAKDGGETQAESARALAYLIADPNVSSIVLGRPHAIPNLLKFIFSCHPRQLKKLSRRSSFEASDSLKGRSMLVTAIMDIVTASCDNVGDVSFKPPLPEDADARDILAALQVVQEGCLHLDESSRSEDDEDGGRGWRGVGIKILEGTTVLGLSRTSGLTELDDTNYSQAEPIKHYAPEISMLQNKGDDLLGHVNMPSTLVPGLWDDLLSEHVAVPFATWALANWARASQVNRSCIQELDEDGCAIMSALVVPERSVRWHASLMAQALLEDCELPLNDFVSDLSSRLLSTISEACKHEDISLAQVSLSAFLLSIKRSRGARNVVMEKGVDTLRSITKQTTEHKQVQEAMAKALELLCIEELHFPLPEGQKWSGILLPWVFGKFSSDAMRSSAVKILSRILEDYGPLSVPVSQGWLALLLTEVQSSVKKSQDNGTSPKSDNAKSLIYNSNAASAAQVVNQLATAVVNLAAKQMESTASDSMEPLPLADFLSLDPFSGLFKKLKKDSVPKLDAANSALATLKGLKALTEVCTEDIQHQEMIVDLGVLCLLRRFLLSDDYEKLAANEAYNASRTHEGHERNSNIDDEPSVSDVNNSSSVRVPPTAHIRRHAARLLTILSNLPKVQKIIIADENWCKWLDECANGRVPGCQDLKIQSYARAALLNVFCNYQYDENTGRGTSPDTGALTNKKLCPRFDDYIFLINPHLPMWKCPKETDQEHSVLKDILATISDNGTGIEQPNDGSCINPINSSKSSVAGKLPSIDIVFVHGLRGGPFKSWRIAEDKSSTQSALVEKIDQEAGKLGTFWPGEWLSGEFPEARMFTLKYKTNLTQWSGASLPLQEVSSMLLEKLVAAGIGDRPVVFVTHSMGGLVVKQILHKAKEEGFDNLVNNSIGMVFYSCPHFGSRLADMPWRMGLVLRPAPSIGELRSGSSKLVELNDYIRHLHKKGSLDVLSFCETTVTPIVEGYGGWALRMEIVSIESAYPGFGELVVLDSTDHINSCKPLSRSDPSYKETLEFIRKLTARS